MSNMAVYTANRLPPFLPPLAECYHPLSRVNKPLTICWVRLFRCLPGHVVHVTDMVDPWRGQREHNSDNTVTA